MATIETLSPHYAGIIVGGVSNPSEIYGGLNWGEYKKVGEGGYYPLVNPSRIYCRGEVNYGQYKKADACG